MTTGVLCSINVLVNSNYHYSWSLRENNPSVALDVIDEGALLHPESQKMVLLKPFGKNCFCFHNSHFISSSDQGLRPTAAHIRLGVIRSYSTKPTTCAW